ncbi:MAG: PAS domain-containing protein, partial [Thermomicrobia bacterium]|nr:PAS domain-containing protein [Thermomicrobia bacterium]
MHRRTDGTPATDEYALLERALAGEETPQRDVPIPDAPDGPRIVSAVASPMRDAHGRMIGAVSVSRDITDRLAEAQERERLLRRIEQEQQFAMQVFANVPVGIAVVRADDFTVLSFNGEYDASIRHAPGSSPLVIGGSLLDALPTASHEAATALLSRARDEQAMVRSTAYAATIVPDRFYDGTIQPLRLSDGTAALLITAVNVTERVRGERERERLHTLVEERRQFAQAIFDTVPVALAVVDTDAMLFSAANPAYLEAVPEPYHSQGVNGCSLTAVLPHTVENGFATQLRETGQTGKPAEAFAQYAHPTRGTTYWNETMIPLTMGDQDAHYALYIAADVTKEIEAEQRAAALAREAAERAGQLEAIFTNMPVGIAVHAVDGRILRMNAVGRQITGQSLSTGTSSSEVIEHFPMRYLDGRPIPQDDLPLARALRGETVAEYELMNRTQHGNAYFLTGSAPIRDAGGEITSAVVMFTDITERKRAEQERERLLREVEERRHFAQTVIESAPVGIVVFAADADFPVRLANEQFLPLIQEPWRSAGVVGAPLA